MNVVILRGTLSRPPKVRTLPSGDELAAFEVTTRDGDGPADSVPVVWFSPPARALRLDTGAPVVVVGRVRRRFYRTPSGTHSRTEVLADEVASATQRKRVERLLAGALAAVDDGPGRGRCTASAALPRLGAEPGCRP